MAHFRSGTRNADGNWSYCLQSCTEQFVEAFPEVNIVYDVFKNHEFIFIKIYEEKHCVCRGKSTATSTVLIENVDAIR